MGKNYYDFINNKIKKMDANIIKRKKEITDIQNEIKSLDQEGSNAHKILKEKEIIMDNILKSYRNKGFKIIVAKKREEIHSWSEINLKFLSNGRIDIVDKEGELIGEIVGDKSKKLRLLVEKLPQYSVAATGVNEDTFEVLVSFA